MTAPVYGAAGGAAAAIANAIKASGAIVRVPPADFAMILARMDSPLVVTARAGFLSSGFRYLTSYKGLAFYCKSGEELQLPGTAEVISAGSIWIPG
jgi:hypothetical protein